MGKITPLGVPHTLVRMFTKPQNISTIIIVIDYFHSELVYEHSSLVTFRLFKAPLILNLPHSFSIPLKC